ncbi:MAG TPA: hypothetical protein VKA37_10325, partial [Halobacteriales archaeon]|nr:hypothetical protein [Halobacteriales archaeon]
MDGFEEGSQRDTPGFSVWAVDVPGPDERLEGLEGGLPVEWAFALAEVLDARDVRRRRSDRRVIGPIEVIGVGDRP